MAFNRIPDELCSLKQWVNWKYAQTIDGKQTKLPLRPIDGKLASATNPLDWADFNTACAAVSHCDGIGFVFTSGDPYCGIDLDNKFNDPSLREYQQQILARLQTYAELSPSGTGLHLICRAKLPGKGRRKGHVEIYDNARFFTFTGNAVNDLPINDCPDAISLWENLGGTEYVETSQEDYAETFSDAEIIERAKMASNGDKFARLYEGDWRTYYGDKSQSEADFALINILAFFSRNRSQIVRLFRASGLGQRPKAQRGAYVGTMVRRAFDRMPPLVSAVPGTGPWFDATFYEPWQAPAAAILRYAASYVPPAALPAPSSPLPPTPGLPAIPGLVGELAEHCWHLSKHQIAEVCIASALASMSVLCGRTHRYNTDGLSLYILLIAKTSTGKDFGYQAIDAWKTALTRRYSDPSAGPQYKLRREFLEGMVTGKIGSAPGIAQHIAKNPSTLAKQDEFVIQLKNMAHPFANQNDKAIEQELLTLTGACMPGAVYYERCYSQRTTKSGPRISVPSPCFVMLCTGTPNDFYDDLSANQLQNGFLPRFVLFEYDGLTPFANTNIIREMHPNTFAKVDTLFNRSFERTLEMNSELSSYVNVANNEEGGQLLADFERQCFMNTRLAQSINEPTAGIWSRASTHCRQIAALIAIGVNPFVPIITKEHARIAIDLIMPGLSKLTGKIVRGEIGIGDNRGEAEIRMFVRRFLSEGPDFCRKCPSFSEEAAKSGYIQVALIKWFVTKRAPFQSHRLGAGRYFDDVFNGMVRSGEFKECEFLPTIKTASTNYKVKVTYYLGKLD